MNITGRKFGYRARKNKTKIVVRKFIKLFLGFSRQARKRNEDYKNN
jgi:hypothetical protein